MNSTTLRSRSSDDRGMIGIAACLLIVMVLAGGALIYDGGRLLVAKRQIINVAEGAARAATATADQIGLQEGPGDRRRPGAHRGSGDPRHRCGVDHRHRGAGHRHPASSPQRRVHVAARQRNPDRHRHRHVAVVVRPGDRNEPSVKQLARYAARSAAAVIVLAIIIGPVVAVAAAAGNPFPADLFDRIGGRNVDDATIVKLLSLCFYVCWAWFCLPALRQLLPAPHRHPRARTATRRPAMSPVPTPPAPPSIVGPTRGPRAALARLARFAVSSAAIVSTLTAIPSGVAASARPHAAVATLVPDATTSDLGPAAPGPVTDGATTLVARHRDTPYAIAHRHFPRRPARRGPRRDPGAEPRPGAP